MDAFDLLTREQKAAALAIAQRWDAWLQDPAHNPAPNPRADVTAAQRELKARQSPSRRTAPADQPDVLGNTMAQRAKVMLKSLLAERARDPEPTWSNAIARAYWARREEARRMKMRRWAVYLP